MGGNIKLSRNDLSATLTALSIETPKLNLSGEMQMDTAGKNIRLKCEGKEIEVSSLRKMTLDIYGEHPRIRDIFNTIQGGRIPHITVTTTGNTLAELGRLDNIVIEFDKVPIDETTDYDSFFDSENTQIEFIRVGKIILINIPSWSEHTITISSIVEAVGGINAVILYIGMAVIIAVAIVIPILTIERGKHE